VQQEIQLFSRLSLAAYEAGHPEILADAAGAKVLSSAASFSTSHQQRTFNRVSTALAMGENPA
jgi:hypothetical protein